MTKQLITLLLLLAGAVSLSAQSSSYETWRKQKTQEYARWQKLRAEMADLPVSPEQQAISNFIDEGFGIAPATGVTHPVNAVSVVPAAPAASTAPAVAAAIPGNMKVWVVVVGVAAYRHIQALNYTDDDAYRMYAFYKSPEGGSLPDNQIRELIDEAATRNNVLRALNEVYSRATSGDAIVFYFSGHGAPEAFVTQEYDGTAVNSGFILHREIQAIFDKSPAKYKYIIADACHSGNWASKGIKSAASAEQQYYQTFESARGGFVMLLSSMGNEYSVENSGVRQGVFSHFLIRGLKGEADANKDRIVSVIELFEYVKTNVTSATNHSQNPVLSGDYKNNPPISIVRE
jgi:uncharacterized caspase-like protein